MFLAFIFAVYCQLWLQDNVSRRATEPKSAVSIALM